MAPENTLDKVESRIVKVKLRDLKLLEKNARYMTPQEFSQLVANIKQDGKLMGVPVVYRGEVLSGNHRVRAAIKAGIEEADVLDILTELTEERRLAIQLSQNAINGKDDPNILAQLYTSLNSLGMETLQRRHRRCLQVHRREARGARHHAAEVRGADDRFSARGKSGVRRSRRAHRGEQKGAGPGRRACHVQRAVRRDRARQAGKESHQQRGRAAPSRGACGERARRGERSCQKRRRRRRVKSHEMEHPISAIDIGSAFRNAQNPRSSYAVAITLRQAAAFARTTLLVGGPSLMELLAFKEAIF